MSKNLRPLLAELAGTFALVLLSAAAVCSATALSPSGPSMTALLWGAVAQGCAYAAALTATVRISGGYLNPAVTLTLWVFKRLDGGTASWLAAMQLLGAVLAGMVVYLSFSTAILGTAHVGTPHLNREAFGFDATTDPRLVMLVGVLMEAALTFVLTLVIYGTMLDSRTPLAPTLGGLGPGLALIAIALAAGPLTGASANPARWFGPAVWEFALQGGAFRDHLAYWLGPCLGALAAGGLYQAFLMPSTAADHGHAARHHHDRKGSH